MEGENSLSIKKIIMYVALTPFTYIKLTEEYGYIANLNIGNQLTFNSTGSSWLSLLSQSPTNIEDLINGLKINYQDVDYDELQLDFMDFLRELESHGFVCFTATCDSNTPKLPQQDLKITCPTPQIKDLTIELTNKCNEKCKHCYLPHHIKEHGKYANLNKTQKIIDEFASMGGKTITFTGGEVLLYRDLSKVIEYAFSKNLKVAIYSNLLNLNNEHIELFKKVGVYEVQTSLYGISSATHDTITNVNGSFDATVHSIKKLIENSIPTKVAYSVMKSNWKETCMVIDLCKEINVPIDVEIYINACIDHSQDNLKQRLSIDEMRTFFNTLMQYDKEFCINLLHRHKNQYDEHFDFLDFLNAPVCSAGYLGLYITTSGSITTCPNLQGISMGENLKSLKEVWEDSPQINKIRHLLEGTLSKCVECEASDFCARCFARNYCEKRDLTIPPEYACEVAFLAKEIITKNKEQLC